MKFFLFFMMILKAQLLFAQNAGDTSIHVDIGLGIDKVKEREKKIQIFSDSLENYKGGAFPNFVFDECFDCQSNLWQGIHSPVSLRWKILEKINNKQALKMLLDTNDKRLKRKCGYKRDANPEIVIPMIKKSFYQLIQKRYKQLV